MSDYEGSEFAGLGPMPNTVYPKDPKFLTPGEKLRLQSLTGQEEDPQASLDPGFWQGNPYFDIHEPSHTYKEREARIEQGRRDEHGRYRETPR